MPAAWKATGLTDPMFKSVTYTYNKWELTDTTKTKCSVFSTEVF